MFESELIRGLNSRFLPSILEEFMLMGLLEVILTLPRKSRTRTFVCLPVI